MTEISDAIKKINKAQQMMQEQKSLVQALLDKSKEVSSSTEGMVNHVVSITRLSESASQLSNEGEAQIIDVVDLMKKHS